MQGLVDLLHCACLFCILIVFRTYVRKCFLYGVSGSFAQPQWLSSVFVCLFFYDIIVIVVIIIIIYLSIFYFIFIFLVLLVVMNFNM